MPADFAMPVAVPSTSGDDAGPPEAGLAARVAAGPGLWEDEDWLADLRRESLPESLLAGGTIAAAAAAEHAHKQERALNAEDALSHAHTEILTQRRRIGELAGTIRDLETPLSTGSAQRITAENTTLHHRIRQLTDEHRQLRERLDAARSASRFLDRRVADLEAQIAEHIVQPT